MILIFIFLITNKVKHVFHILAIQISFVVFKYFAIFLMDSLSYPFFNFSVFFGLFFFFFLPLHLTCEILVPQAGIEPRPWQ